MHTIGNTDILKNYKKAFLCSRRYPAAIVTKIYDWAIDQRETGQCIISGFHSRIEKDVFHYLLKGTQPIVLALARGLPKKIYEMLLKEIEKERLLIVTPFNENVARAKEETARKRNKFMVEMADEIIIGYASNGGNITKLIKKYEKAKTIKNII